MVAEEVFEDAMNVDVATVDVEASEAYTGEVVVDFVTEGILSFVLTSCFCIFTFSLLSVL